MDGRSRWEGAADAHAQASELGTGRYQADKIPKPWRRSAGELFGFCVSRVHPKSLAPPPGDRSVSSISARFHRREIICSLYVFCLPFQLQLLSRHTAVLGLSFGLIQRRSRCWNAADKYCTRPWACKGTSTCLLIYFKSTTAHMQIHEPRHPRNCLRYQTRHLIALQPTRCALPQVAAV